MVQGIPPGMRLVFVVVHALPCILPCFYPWVLAVIYFWLVSYCCHHSLMSLSWFPHGVMVTYTSTNCVRVAAMVVAPFRMQAVVVHGQSV